jgi:hypothetical protein
MERNWDPDITKFFIKIANSISWGLLWMITTATAGIYFELGYSNGKPKIYTILFYIVSILTFLLLLRYLYKTWKQDSPK